VPRRPPRFPLERPAPHRVQANYVGTDSTAAKVVGSGGVGVELINTADVLVGGDEPGARNIISGNTNGLRLVDATGTAIVGNWIGATRASSPPSATARTASDSTAPPSAPPCGNVVANNAMIGIRANGGYGNVFLSNSIYSNGAFGIDLGGDGGAVPGRYGFASFTYADQVATWRLNRPLGNDRILLELKSAGSTIRSATPSTAFSGRTTSGNGAPGGDFRYRFNVQPGHVTRWFQTSVTAMDTVNILRRYGSSIQSNGTASPRYWQYADINGDGRINAIDLVLARNNQRNPLPEAPPVI
jgi:hypothetical protein